MYPLPTRETAIAMRKQGYSYLHISTQLGIPKSTLSGWLTDVPYTANAEMIEQYGKARAKAGERRAQMKKDERDEIRRQALSDISDRDLFLFGLAIYLGEGAKTGNVVRICNSDPRVIKCMISWFKLLGVNSEQFSPRIFIYPDLVEAECLQFWSQTTTIPESQFKKAIVDRRTDKKERSYTELPYGTLHLDVRSMGRKEFGTRFFKKIQIWNEVVLENVQKRD